MKTIYFLGAGFSQPAGFPLQSQILPQILRLEEGNVQAPHFTVLRFKQARAKLVRFLQQLYPSGNVPQLEDLFTLLDQSIAQRESCANYTWVELHSVREALKRLILFLLHHSEGVVSRSTQRFYTDIATSLINTRLKEGLKPDNIAIISSNWDCLLENAIFSVLTSCKGLGKMDIDYCCYTTPLARMSPHVPSVQQKARGVYNIKIMKLHGSTNWLICPNCRRLFTGIGSDENRWKEYVQPRFCDKCVDLRLISPELCDEDEERKPYLEPFFITPTLIKVFDNAHIQSIWHNAFVNLTEADEIIFVGYSLPLADYHVRTLLRRATCAGKKMTIVLRAEDSSGVAEPNLNFAADRFRAFFGTRQVTVYRRGMTWFFNRLLRQELSKQTPQHIRQQLATIRPSG